MSIQAPLRDVELDPADAAYTWNRGRGPFPRLYEDVMRSYFEGNRRCWEAVASPMAREHIVLFVDGWSYHRGPAFDDEKKAQLDAHHKMAAGLRDSGRSYYIEELRPQCVEIAQRLRPHPRPSRPLTELVAHLEDSIEAFAHIMGDLHWRMAAGISGTASRPRFEWPETYAEITGRSPDEATIFVGGLMNPLSRTVKTMRRLARLAASDPELRDVVERGDVAALKRPQFKRFRVAFDRMLRRDGHRTGAGWGSTQAIGAPTWNIKPQIPLGLIAAYMRSDLDETDRKELEAVRERRRLLRTVRRQLASDPERGETFEFELRRAKMYAVWTEDHNYWMDQSSAGLVRDAAHIVGLRLVRDGVIDDAEDVLHLSLDELRSPPPDARDLIEGRKRDFERQAQTEPPEHIGAPPPEGGGPMIRHDEGVGLVGDALHGVAASGGRYTGRARVCMPSPIPPDVQDGDILVAVDAGPDWTPLFAILGAVVLDKGAAWQHAAVMAREFGIPAVTGTKDGTSVVEDGQTITVDGDAGIVELRP